MVEGEGTREGVERKRAGKARGGEGGGDDDSNTRKREREGRRDETGGRRAGTPGKNGRGGCTK
jgi:hypothetical protein